MCNPSTSSAPSLGPSAEDHKGSASAQPRSMWTEAETWVLIRLWEDHLPQLRGEKHNARVYDAIVVALAQNGIVRTRRQVQTKIDNLTQRYRRESRQHTTGSSPSPWPFFSEIHRFLGSLPANDRSLIQESPCSTNETVEMIISSMEAGTCAEERPDMPQPSNDSKVIATAQSVPQASSIAEAQTTQQKRRPAKRKRVSATETFRNTLLEQQSKLIAALEDATKADQVLRERQVKAQEKLVDLMSGFFNK
ncbi:hypothetical protein HPB52_021958 [Rhipicephalus sanguineus]|uniref:Myb/SANT-like DNA-binding domain-containing protein n=1 Tax=Rhipicephalus sanguineus TaxID=34632 RepID=A0A9D4Q7U4_RHISA|nr:hypothetical protein HPB52_021958 [Rhipicephalus sanguineus]